MRTKYALFLLSIITTIGLSPLAAEAEHPGSYLVLKGGIYSPSSTFNFGNLDIETTFDSDTRTGVAGEIGIGHYVLPTLALELGVGYFKGKGSLATQGETSIRHEVDFDVIPVLVTAKALIPVGQVDPYGELGLGAYFTSFDVGDNLKTFSGDTSFGLHAGAGMNVNITRSVFVGVEGRYVWANPSFGDQPITLNSTDYVLKDFELNGFNTTLALGYSF
jgi:outer membrane protein W